MKRIFITIPIILSIIGCKEQQQTIQIPPTSVSYIEIKTQPVQLKRELSGIVNSYLESQVRPEVSGIIKERLFDEGAYVKQDQILYKIDPDLYKAQYDQAVAALSKAEANFTTAKNKYFRYKSLIDKKLISKQDFDDVEANYKVASSAIEETKAILETAKINLERTDIKAPISGYIGISNFTVGALVSVGQTKELTTIRQISPIYIDITQSSRDLLSLNKMLADNSNIEKSNQNIQIVLEDNSIFNEIGTFKLSEHNIDPTTSTINVRAEVPNEKHILLPGMFVKAIIHDAVDHKGILVPQRAVQRDSKAVPFVFILNDENKVEQKSIQIDKAMGDNWLLKSGLNENDKIIIEGLNKIRNGMTVSPSLFDPNQGEK